MEDSSMQLLLDAGTFYEFVPAGQADEEFPEAVPVWKVEEGETYALVITACNGLWRYPLGDTVTVKSVDPLKIVIAGRTKHYINAFGEELMVHNADAAITRACGLTGARGGQLHGRACIYDRQFTWTPPMAYRVHGDAGRRLGGVCRYA